MAGKKVAVIIPIYKVHPEAGEIVSLKQCISILKNHPILFIGPKQLDTSSYQEICKDSIPFHLITFDDQYFSGIAGYNQLMLSPGFYETFIGYEYILIYQLDAYVFKDELHYWCDKNFDFIGAPHCPHNNIDGEIRFLSGYSRLLSSFNRIFGASHKISHVGNGGFSLRKTRSCYRLLKYMKSRVSKWGQNNEDVFFTYWGNLLHPFFQLPSDDEALHFAVEQSPGEALKKLGNVLPFGCHAFEKYEPELWSKYIYN